MTELTGGVQNGGTNTNAQAGAGNVSGATGGNSNSSNNTSGTWLSSLPEELRTNPSLTSFTNVENLAKSYISTKEMVGKKGAIIPGEKATDEEWSGFFDSLGRPPLDKYEIQMPKDVSVNKDLVGKFKEVFHKSGLLPKQAQPIFYNYLTI